MTCSACGVAEVADADLCAECAAQLTGESESGIEPAPKEVTAERPAVSFPFLVNDPQVGDRFRVLGEEIALDKAPIETVDADGAQWRAWGCHAAHSRHASLERKLGEDGVWRYSRNFNAGDLFLPNGGRLTEHLWASSAPEAPARLMQRGLTFSLVEARDGLWRYREHTGRSSLALNIKQINDLRLQTRLEPGDIYPVAQERGEELERDSPEAGSATPTARAQTEVPQVISGESGLGWLWIVIGIIVAVIVYGLVG